MSERRGPYGRGGVGASILFVGSCGATICHEAQIAPKTKPALCTRIDREANKPDLLTLLPNLSTTTNEFTNQKEHFTKAVTMASTSIAAEPAQDVPIFLRSKSQSCAPRPVGGLRVPHVGRENVPFAKMLCHRRMRSFHHDGLF